MTVPKLVSVKEIIPKILIGIFSLILAVPINAVVFRRLVKPNTAELAVENESNFLIETADIKLCEIGKQIKQLEPGKSASVKFDNVGECHYSVNVNFEGGKALSTEVGYITSGSDFKDSVVVEGSQIITNKPVNQPDPYYFADTAALFLSYAIITFLMYRASLSVLKRVRKR